MPSELNQNTGDGVLCGVIGVLVTIFVNENESR